jgi:hypothetical protein
MTLNQIQVSTVGSLDSRTDLVFISDSSECAEIRFDFGDKWEGFDYDSYLVHAEDGEYKEIWGMSGIVPYKSKLVTRIL